MIVTCDCDYVVCNLCVTVTYDIMLNTYLSLLSKKIKKEKENKNKD